MLPSTRPPRRTERRAAVLNDDRRFVGEVLAGDELSDFECPYCHKLQFRARLREGSLVETKCTRQQCRRWLKFQVL